MPQPAVEVHWTVQPVELVQLWHEPFTHSWPLAQIWLGPHWVGQPVLPGVQAAWQMPPTHERLGSLQAASVPAELAQHAWPALPHCGAQLPFAHGWHSPFKQLLPVGQATPAEQVCRQEEPVALQAVHWPLEHS